MKPRPEAGVIQNASNFFIPFPSEFAKKNLFYTDRCGHYFVNKHYSLSRSFPIQYRFAIFYIVKGEMIFIIGDREYHAHEHEVVLLDMSFSHLYASIGDSEIFWLCFDGLCSEDIVRRVCHYSHVYAPPRISRIYTAMNEILQGFINNIPLYEEQISSNLHMILTDLLVMQYDALSKNPSIIKQIVNYIEENYHLPLSNQVLSEMACLNPCYFGQKFKAEMGISPKQYLINTRLNAAKKLLFTTRWSIAEISERVGFQNDTYFSYLFHKRFEITPTEYRKSDIFSQL